MTKKQKLFRFDDQTLEKFEKLKVIYETESSNQVIKKIISDMYDIKQTKALVPFEDLDARDRELKQAFFELGKLQGVIEEKDKQLQLAKEHSGFWSNLSRLFGS